MCVPGCVTVLQTDGSAFALVEKDLPSKLELLFRKSLYGIAISLIQAEGGTEAAVAEVRRRLADHLYAKQDYDGAMAQYVQTIGCAPAAPPAAAAASRSPLHSLGSAAQLIFLRCLLRPRDRPRPNPPARSFVEPSYVVRLFLDARRIDNLTAFLEALHSRGEATADHTTLLLNCYTKLKVVAKLDAFLSAGDAGETPEQYRERFDVHTVLKARDGSGRGWWAGRLGEKGGGCSRRRGHRSKRGRREPSVPAAPARRCAAARGTTTTRCRWRRGRASWTRS